MAEVIVTISPEGEVNVEAKCIKGASCQDATRAIEKALGVTTEDKATREMYERGSNVQHKHQS